MSKQLSASELVIVADRSIEHPKGAKRVGVFLNGAAIPSGVILGHLTHLTIKQRNYYTDGSSEVVDWPAKEGR